MRSWGIVLVVVAAVAVACGVQYDGPPPRYADAPPEPSPTREPPRPVADASDAGTPVAADAAGAAPTDADGGAVPATADAGAAAALLATGPLTLAQWNEMLEVGRRKFNRVCAECHGTGIGPVLNGRHKTADRVRHMVRAGAGDMRPLSQRRVSDEELEAVIVFLSTIRAVIDVNPPPGAP